MHTPLAGAGLSGVFNFFFFFLVIFFISLLLNLTLGVAQHVILSGDAVDFITMIP